MIGSVVRETGGRCIEQLDSRIGAILAFFPEEIITRKAFRFGPVPKQFDFVVVAHILKEEIAGSHAVTRRSTRLIRLVRFATGIQSPYRVAMAVGEILIEERTLGAIVNHAIQHVVAIDIESIFRIKIRLPSKNGAFFCGFCP